MRPAPEVHVEVLKVLRMCADAPRSGRHPAIKRRFASVAALFDPTAAPLCLLLIRWIADNHCDRLAPLDRFILHPRISDGNVRRREAGRPVEQGRSPQRLINKLMPISRWWPMFNQVRRRQKLMDHMMQSLGVDVLVAIRADEWTKRSLRRAPGVIIASTKAIAETGSSHLRRCHCLRNSVLTPISSACSDSTGSGGSIGVVARPTLRADGKDYRAASSPE